MSRIRPWRSSKAPAIGLTSRPGRMLASVTAPASEGDWYSVRVNRTRATLTIDWAIRARIIEVRIRGSHGTPSRARYEGSEADMTGGEGGCDAAVSGRPLGSAPPAPLTTGSDR